MAHGSTWYKPQSNLNVDPGIDFDLIGQEDISALVNQQMPGDNCFYRSSSGYEILDADIKVYTVLKEIK